MKHRIRQMMLLVTCIFLCACKGDTNETTALQETESNKETTEVSQTAVTDRGFDCDYYMRTGFLTEDMALYHDNHERLQIYDVKSGLDLVFCFDPGCEHERGQKSHTGEVIKKGCIAYEFFTDTVMLQGDNCYFMDRFSGEVYRKAGHGYLWTGSFRPEGWNIYRGIQRTGIQRDGFAT